MAISRTNFRQDNPRRRTRGGLLEVGVQANFNDLNNLRGVNAADLEWPFRELLDPVEETAKQLVHVKTGALQGTIRIEVREKSRTRLKIGVTAGDSSVNGVGVFYAPFQEFGTSSHPPYPYLRPAWDAHKTEIREKMKAVIWKMIKDRAKNR